MNKMNKMPGPYFDTEFIIALLVIVCMSGLIILLIRTIKRALLEKNAGKLEIFIRKLIINISINIKNLIVYIYP